MIISILVYEDQYGTELGELCPPTYHYECSEYDPNSNCNFGSLQFKVEGLPNKLKGELLGMLNQHLNREFSDWQPGCFQTIIDKLRTRTIRASSHYSVGALFGLFSSSLPIDVVGLINNQLDKRDILSVVLTSRTPHCVAEEFVETACLDSENEPTPGMGLSFKKP
jgi:hypothetical protein